MLGPGCSELEWGSLKKKKKKKSLELGRGGANFLRADLFKRMVGEGG